MIELRNTAILNHIINHQIQRESMPDMLSLCIISDRCSPIGSHC